jgi:hypothetical protein
MTVLVITNSPKHADNENNRNHHNDEQRDDALREIRIFRHCLVPYLILLGRFLLRRLAGPDHDRRYDRAIALRHVVAQS